MDLELEKLAVDLRKKTNEADRAILKKYFDVGQRAGAAPPDLCMEACCKEKRDTANLRTRILDFRGFDSSVILILKGGIPRTIISRKV